MIHEVVLIVNAPYLSLSLLSFNSSHGANDPNNLNHPNGRFLSKDSDHPNHPFCHDLLLVES